ncbi:MAG: Crp/Fnr family transcriptional regulator [Bacteroidales bacterium]|jgi:CRP/FNR family transcriptional regulator|nr:Crp/Fnr family transcriptional regulator [Bacteroidales bacterium]
MNKLSNGGCLHCKAKSDIFDHLSEEELDRVESCRVSMHYRAGEIVFKQGSPCYDFVCITSGLVKLYIEGENDRRLIIGFVKPVDYIFVPGAYVDKRHHYTAVACEETSACLVETEVLQNLVNTNPEFANSFIKKISSQAISLITQIASVTQKQIPGRMADTLIYLATKVYNSNPFITSLSRQDLADLSGMTKESAIRVLKTFKDDELIVIRGDEIELLNIPMLETISRNG